MNWMSAVAIGAGLGIGNFMYQAFTKREWGVALERSFFQAVAVTACALAGS